MTYQHIQIPANGQKITVNADMSLNVPDQPIIPFIEGDGTGLDITPVITHHLHYTEFEKGFEAMKAGQSGKVILNWLVAPKPRKAVTIRRNRISDLGP